MLARGALRPGRRRRVAAQERRRLGERLDAPRPRRSWTSAASGPRARGTISPRCRRARDALGDGERPAARPQLAAERQLAEDRPALERLGRHLPARGEHADRDREVEARARPCAGTPGARFAVMRFCGNSKPLLWIAARTRSRDSRTALSPSPTIVERGQTQADVDLDRDAPRLDPVDRERRDARERHQNAASRWSSETSLPGGVDRDADRVEAQLLRPRAGRRPRRGTPRPSGAPAGACARGGCPTAGPAPRRALTSTNTSVVAVERDEVDLAEARAVVAGDDRVAEPLEVRGRELLGRLPEEMSSIRGHARRR